MSGWLYKLSGGNKKQKSFEKRYFVINEKEKKILYYYNETKKILKGVIDLNEKPSTSTTTTVNNNNDRISTVNNDRTSTVTTNDRTSTVTTNDRISAVNGNDRVSAIASLSTDKEDDNNNDDLSEVEETSTTSIKKDKKNKIRLLQYSDDNTVLSNFNNRNKFELITNKRRWVFLVEDFNLKMFWLDKIASLISTDNSNNNNNNTSTSNSNDIVQDVLTSGYLYKLSGNKNDKLLTSLNWKRRFFEINFEANKLEYYVDDTKTNKKGFFFSKKIFYCYFLGEINMNSITEIKKMSDDNATNVTHSGPSSLCKFELVSNERTWVLATEIPEMKEGWLNNLLSLTQVKLDENEVFFNYLLLLFIF